MKQLIFIFLFTVLQCNTASLWAQNIPEDVALEKDEFEATYTQAEALVINSYRQHAVGNIITAIKYGCKIYLNKRSSTYHWLVSKGFLINEVDNLKNDIESGNIKLSVEEQQHNLDCFVKAVKDYSVEDFVNNVVTILEEK